MIYELKTEQFSGPIEKLLELIEEKKLAVTSVSLSLVTADFLKFTETLTRREPRLLADFLAVAAKLLLLKSRSLLPSLAIDETEEEDLRELTERVRFFQSFRKARISLRRIWEKDPRSFEGSFSYLTSAGHLMPAPRNLSTAALGRAFGGTFETLAFFERESKEFRTKIVSVEEKIKAMLLYLRRGAFSFREAAAGTRGEIIALFLALLYLIKSGKAKAEQGRQFEDIVVS